MLYVAMSYHHYWMPYLLIFVLMLIGPALFLYIAAITRPRFTLKPIYLAHLAPGIVSVGVMALFGIDGNDMRHIWTMGQNSPEAQRSEEHTSELQSRGHLVCRLLLEIKNKFQ